MITKDPNSTITYYVDWTDFLGSDTIASSAWTVPAGLTQVGTETHTTHIAYVQVKDGVLGETYVLVNRVTTASGQIEDQSLPIYIKEH